MELSNELLKKFAKITNSRTESKKDSFIRGTVSKNGDTTYVKFDGSDVYTPVSASVDVDNGHRVLVLVKNHSGTIISNMSSPAVNNANLAGYKTIVADDIYAVNAEIENIKAVSITTENLEAKVAVFGYLSAETADLKYATIETLNATNAKIENLEAESITTDTLEAKIAELDYLTAHSAEMKYATIDLANIAAGAVKNAMIDVGAIGTAQIADGAITNLKVADGLDATKITVGILSVERLIIRGSEKSLVYELNNISGALQAKNVDTLNGEILTPRTITADKIVANSITGNEIAAKTITANNIVANSITSDEIAAGGVKAVNIDSYSITADKLDADIVTTDKILFGDMTVTELLKQSVEKNASIEKTLDGLSLDVSSLSTKNDLTNNGSIQTYDVTETPTLNNYPTTTDFFIWSMCSDTLYCDDSLICGTSDYDTHLNQIAYNTKNGFYYVFEKNTDGVYGWRQLSSAEVSTLADKYASVNVLEGEVVITAGYESEKCEVKITSKGMKSTVLYCC